jgi:hypothetical protein
MYRGYNKESEGGIIWNDPVLNIDWPIENPNVSEKDLILPSFQSYFKNDKYRLFFWRKRTNWVSV